jgi:hypothetical protein
MNIAVKGKGLESQWRNGPVASPVTINGVAKINVKVCCLPYAVMPLYFCNRNCLYL